MRKLLSYVILFGLLQVPTAGEAQVQHSPPQDTMVMVGNDVIQNGAEWLRFDTIGQLVPVSPRHIPASLIDSLKNDDDFWYANATPQKKKAEKAVTEQAERSSITGSKTFRDLLWIVILFSFIAVVIWYLIASNILIFRKEPKKIGSPTEEDSFDDIFSIDYEAEIAAAEKTNDYRLAVRLWYLNLLKELTDKGLIDYRYGRTNQDYVQQLYKTDYYRDFFRLTQSFDYTWYGQFNPSAGAYRTICHDFSTFKGRLRR